MPINCTITDIAWERIHLTLTVRATIDDTLPARPGPTPAVEASRSAAAIAAHDGGEAGLGLEIDDSDGDDLSAPAPVERVEVKASAVPERDINDLTFVIRDTDRDFPVESERIDSGTYLLRFNIIDFRDRRQIPDGTWRIIPMAKGRPQYPATYPLDRTIDFDTSSRVFMYSGNKTAYTVSFGFSEADDRPDLLMRTYQLFRSGGRPRASRVARWKRKVNSKKNRLRIQNEWYRLQRRLDPPNGKRILFASEARGKLEGNLLAVHDRMVERGLDKEFEFRYSFRLPKTKTTKSTLETIRLLATSDIVLIDDYFGMLAHIDTDPSTRIIQLWHAGSGFKSVGYSRFGRYGSPTLTNAHRKYTYAITGSTQLAHVYAEAFGIEESAVIPTGLPRIDKFLDEERTARVRADFFAAHPHLEGKRIVLFAPTFRGRGMHDAYYDYHRIDFDRLYEACGDDTVVLFRMHHFVRRQVPIRPEHADRFFDFSAFPETNDLLQVTDVLITDYSSIIYEYSLLDRPMLFFAYDKVVYQVTRGFHRDFDETAPGRVCETFEELVEALVSGDFETEKIEAFRRENFDNIDTHSSDRVIDQLILSTPAETGRN
jgi:CDP-ribitol ribitolphosphotransferase